MVELTASRKSPSADSPTDWIKLRDGSSAQLRPPTRADADALFTLLSSLSLESRRLRFFSLACDLKEAAQWAATADGIDDIGLVALDSAGRIVGHAACSRISGPRGEVAVEVDDAHRHLGLGSLLVRRLARDAEKQGIRQLIAEVLPENQEMLSVFHDEFRAQAHWVDGEVDVEFPAAAWHSSPAR